MGLFDKIESENTVDELLKKSEEVEKQAQEARAKAAEKKEETTISKVKITGDVNDPHSLAYLNANAVDVVSAIEILGDEDTFEKMLKEFSTTIKNKHNRLIDSKATQNLKDYATAANDIKTTANYVGLNKLYEIAKDHAYKAECNDFNYIAENYKVFDDELNRVIGVLAMRYQ